MLNNISLSKSLIQQKYTASGFIDIRSILRIVFMCGLFYQRVKEKLKFQRILIKEITKIL